MSSVVLRRYLTNKHLFCPSIPWRGLIYDTEQRNTSMNIFPCHEQGVWQCEWHDDCLSNFTLSTPGISIIIRESQQPDAPQAIEFADPNAKFVAVNQANTSSTAANPATAAQDISPTSSSISTSIISTLVSTESSPPTDPPSYSTPTPATSSSLSVGSKAGIAVGAAAGALTVGTLLCAVVVRRRRRMFADGSGATPPGLTDLGDAGHLCRNCRKPELTGQAVRTELNDTHVRPELMSQNLRWEMGAEPCGDH